MLPILPHLLTQLCRLSTCLGSLGLAMKVFLTFGFLGMLILWWSKMIQLVGR